MKKLEKIIEYLFYLFIFLLPWQARYFLKEGQLSGEYWEYGSFSLYLTDLLFLLILWLFLILQIKKQGQIKEDKPSRKKGLIFFTLGLLSIGLLSLYWAVDGKLALYAWFRLLQGVVLFWLVSKINFSLKKATAVLVGAGTLQGLLAIIQFFSQRIFSSKYLGMALNNPANLGTIVIESGGRYLRAYGSLPHPNILAGFLVIAWLLTLGLYFQTKAFSYSKILAVICLVIIVSGLFFTFSRAAWFLFLANFLFLFLIFLRKKITTKFEKINLLKFLFISLLIFIVLAAIYPNLVSTRFDLENRLENLSITQRQNYYQDAIEIIKTNWLHGVGLGNFTEAVYHQIDPTRPAYLYQPVHNIYLLILSELSIFGFLVFLLLIIEFFKLVWKNKNFLGRTENPWFSIYFLTFLSFLFLGFFDHYSYTLNFGIMSFWLFLGLFEKSRKIS